MIFAGIDAGSRAIKVVLINEDHRILTSDIQDQGINQSSEALQLLEHTAAKIKIEIQDIDYIIATGYGRDALDFANSTVTEITCHARGVFSLMPQVRTIIDIGGQDCKLMQLNSTGKVRDFVMNDRCAAGTGRFLEVVARQLRLNILDLGEIATQANRPAVISSMCVVFAETEIIGLLAAGEKPENIVAGVQNSIAARIVSMAGRQIEEPIVFTGGVALIPGMVETLSGFFSHPITVPENPQFTGALGAAILAGRHRHRTSSKR